MEKIGLAADAQRGKLQAALDAGDASGVDRAAAKLGNLVERQAEAATKATAATAAMNEQAAALDKLKNAASEAAADEAKVSTALDEAKSAAEAAGKAQAAAAGSGKVSEMAEGFGKLGGPLGDVGRKAFGAADGLKKLSSSLGAAGPYAAVAIAIVAITTAVFAVTAAMASWAVSNADAARTSTMLAAGVAGSVKGGQQLEDTIHALGTKTTQTHEELLAMAEGLKKTGLSGNALSAALEDTATKAAKLKYGPDFQKQTLSLTSQAARLRDNISGPKGIFSGLKIDSLLEGFSKLVALFDSSSASGNAIKVLFESLFQPLIDGVVAFIPKAVAAFLQFEILVLKAMIAIKPFGSKLLFLAEVFGGIIVAALAIFAAAVIISFIPFIVAIAVTVAIIAALIWLGNAAVDVGKLVMKGAGDAWDYVTAKFNAAIAFLQSMSLSEIGTQMINGLVEGIKNAAGAVLQAMTGVVGGAIDGAKKMLGIASPSKVFAEIGMNTGAGMAGGVDKSADSVQGSLEAMVAPPDAPGISSSGAGAASGKAAGGNYAGATFNFYGVAGAEDALDRFLALIEGDVAQSGSTVPT